MFKYSWGMKMPIHANWRTLFGIVSVQGLVASVWLIRIPTDTENPAAFGFSVGRLALIGVAFILTFLCSLLFIGYHYFDRYPVIAQPKRRTIFLDIVYGLSLGTVVIVLVFGLRG